jgi:hypothetical protein
MQKKWETKKKLEREGRNSIFDFNAKKMEKRGNLRGKGEIPYSILMQRKWEKEEI